MSVYYKAVRPNGRDWHSDSVQWAPPDGHEGEWIVRHPTATTAGWEPGEHLSVSTVVTDCTGFLWPARLLVVEAVDPEEPVCPSGDLPNKRAGVAFRVVGERPAHELFGPQGEQVVELIERARTLSGGELDRLAAAWGAALTDAWGAAEEAAWFATRYAARDAAWYAARYAPWAAPWAAARDASRDATLALVSRDLIGQYGYTQEHCDVLTRPWRSVIGPIHPDDQEVRS